MKWLTSRFYFPASVLEPTASITIPVDNGVLSIRPYAIKQLIDPNLIRKIDRNTFAHLRKLKATLEIVMAGYNARKCTDKK